MAFSTDLQTIKTASYECIYDRSSVMSGRVAALFIYATIRLSEIIDYWFPVKK